MKWLLDMSVDAINLDYSEFLESDSEPDFWYCYEIAEKHGCSFWTISEFEEA